MKRATIHINLQAVLDAMQRSLQRTMNLVTVGLRVNVTAEHLAAGLPDVGIKLQLAANEPWTPERTAVEWSRWILLNGFRDAAESVHALLEELLVVLAYLKLKTDSGMVEWLKLEDYEAKERRPIHRLGYRDKRAKVVSYVALDAGLLSEVDSIMTARNCLVHRNGTVTEKEVVDGSFELRWHRMAMYAVKDGISREVDRGEVLWPGEVLRLNVRPRRKSFPLGEQIQLSAAEFSEICWTLIWFAQNVADAVQRHGQSVGVNFGPWPEAPAHGSTTASEERGEHRPGPAQDGETSVEHASGGAPIEAHATDYSKVNHAELRNQLFEKLSEMLSALYVHDPRNSTFNRMPLTVSLSRAGSLLTVGIPEDHSPHLLRCRLQSRHRDDGAQEPAWERNVSVAANPKHLQLTPDDIEGTADEVLNEIVRTFKTLAR